MSRSFVRYLAIPTVLIAAACGGSDERKLDEALRQDLWLAARTSPYAPYMSPLEQGYGYGAPGYQPQPYGGGYMPAVARQTPVVRRAPVATRAPAPAAEPQVEIVRNTKRDAAIGAAAGAAIGVATSRDKIKGAVIGAAAGGLLGAIIGHTVDVKRVPR